MGWSDASHAGSALNATHGGLRQSGQHALGWERTKALMQRNASHRMSIAFLRRCTALHRALHTERGTGGSTSPYGEGDRRLLTVGTVCGMWEPGASPGEPFGAAAKCRALWVRWN